jgi:hypothetical protein
MIKENPFKLFLNTTNMPCLDWKEALSDFKSNKFLSLIRSLRGLTQQKGWRYRCGSWFTLAICWHPEHKAERITHCTAEQQSCKHIYYKVLTKIRTVKQNPWKNTSFSSPTHLWKPTKQPLLEIRKSMEKQKSIQQFKQNQNYKSILLNSS